MSDIKPALTVEEWVIRLNGDHGRGKHRNGIPFLDPEGGDVRVTYDSGYAAERIPEDERHPLAALALHGQPFGFTREDLADLRRLSNVQTCGAVADGITDDTPAFKMAQRVASLTDRIGALLPSEGK